MYVHICIHDFKINSYLSHFMSYKLRKKSFKNKMQKYLCASGYVTGNSKGGTSKINDSYKKEVCLGVLYVCDVVKRAPRGLFNQNNNINSTPS